jgi:phosphatidyl-myo-inositol alpha-mannosyltransferase|uniref:glycosyltransferase family 4 protein n=2 Tax=Candidatus Planktophila sp. TaxID=2175601 RepID=UPI00404A33FB
MINRKLRIGLVCPYSWDVPGGVQNHIRDLAEFLINNGHHVEVLAPATESEDLPDYVVSAGRAVSIPYNGAVARVLFGVGANSRVRSWINDGDFDLLHLHEPAIPSLSLLACWAGEGAMVGTFHAAAKYQKAIFAIGPILEPVIEKLSARIAVSESARLTLTAHLETDAIVIPNGIYADNYRDGSSRPEWQGNTIGFLGRFEEDRKGLPVLLEALPIISRFIPDIRVLIAGPGESEEVLAKVDPQLRNRVEFLGKISEEDKADFLASVSLYIAPNTGGESFGIILAEAMAGGAAVVASDIPAFADVLGNGQYGALFESENSEDLAKVIIDLLRDETKRRELAAAGAVHAQRFDWGQVGEEIFEVYELAMVSGQKVSLTSENRSWTRLLGRD